LGIGVNEAEMETSGADEFTAAEAAACHVGDTNSDASTDVGSDDEGKRLDDVDVDEASKEPMNADEVAAMKERRLLKRQRQRAQRREQRGLERAERSARRRRPRDQTVTSTSSGSL